MDFRPEVNERIIIDQPFIFCEHPAAPGLPYGQSGRRGTVYQIRLEDGSYHALKVFVSHFQDERNALMAQRLQNFAGMPGLQVCYRKVIIPRQYPHLIQKYPQLGYGVVMPWVEGETWYDIMFGVTPLTAGQSYGLARDFVHCLCEMENRRLAHCDLSGANILMQIDQARVALVDVEEMYGPDLKSPDQKKLPAGTPGYAHSTASRGLWSPEADRFAGAVLLAEILGWSSERVRESASEGQYFEKDEVQTLCKRYQTLREVLRREWGNPVSSLFAQAWFSKQLKDCPTFHQWESALGELSGSEAYPRPAPVEEDPQPDEPLPSQPAAEPVLEKVYTQIDEDLSAPKIRRLAGLGDRVRTWATRLTRRTAFVLSGAAVLLILIIAGAAWLFIPRGSGVIQGSVLDSQTRQPLQAKITLTGPGITRSVTSQSDGTFTFTGLPSMTGKVKTELAGYASAATDVQATDKEQTQVEPILLQLTGSKVYGRVMDASSGAALKDATVSISGAYGENGQSISEKRSTDQDGSFEFILDGAAQVNLNVSKSGYETSQLPLKIASGKLIQVNDISLLVAQ
jgi:hypothetical protein